jgi:hypothetical protein
MAVDTTLDQTLRLLNDDYPDLNPRAIAVAEQIAPLLDVDCKNDGRAVPSETGCCFSWVHRELFCHVDTEEDDTPPDGTITIMIHKPNKGVPFSWKDHVEYPSSPELAAERLMELWREEDKDRNKN